MELLETNRRHKCFYSADQGGVRAGGLSYGVGARSLTLAIPPPLASQQRRWERRGVYGDGLDGISSERRSRAVRLQHSLEHVCRGGAFRASRPRDKSLARWQNGG